MLLKLNLCLIKVLCSSDILVVPLKSYINFLHHLLAYNPGHNILRLFDVFPNFLFITSEMNREY